MDAYIPIGRTGKSHGTAGELKFFVDDRYLEDFLEAEAVFLEIEGKKLPFFIEGFREANDLLVKLEEVDTPEAAHPLSGRQAFLREKDLLAQDSGNLPPQDQYERYTGYQVRDIRLGAIGRIEEIIEMPQQFLALIRHEGREVFIPLHASLIQKIDTSKKEIFMDLPDGILAL